MYIESEIGKLSRYSSNAIEAFRVAVDNGQARLAMQILVDVIDAYAEKFDEYDALIEEKLNVITPDNEQVVATEEVIVETKVEAETAATAEVKSETIENVESVVEEKQEVKNIQPKVKIPTKETQTQK